jgi:hypothetical protein
MIQSLFGGIGKIRTEKELSVSYTVTSIKDLPVIIEHYDKYPLITQKRADYLLFKQAFELIKLKEHLTLEGLNKLVAIKASINKGLSPQLKAAFPNITPVQRLEVVDQVIKDPNWLAGFTDAEGCFFVGISKKKFTKTGYSVQLRFIISQHSKDTILINSLTNFFKCGKIMIMDNKSMVEFRVCLFKDIIEKVIPFFDKYSLYGAKILDSVDFCKIASMMKSKTHLTVSGLEEIRRIKSNMNRGRI